MNDICKNTFESANSHHSPFLSSDNPEEIVRQIRLAMLCGRVNCALAGSDIWDQIPAEGDCPTPAELIIWAAARVQQRLAEEEG